MDMRRICSALAALLLLVLPVASAWAGPLTIPVNGTDRTFYKARYALVIAAGNYTNGWPRLTQPPRDAANLSAALTKQGFEVTVAPDPKGAELYGLIYTFIVNHGAPDTALMIVFSGHGWTDADTNTGYIVGVDAPTPSANPMQLRTRALSMRQLRTLAEESQAKHTLFVFDSCFSGSFFSTRSDNARPPAEPRQWDMLRYEAFGHRTVQAMTSGSEKQKVPDDGAFMRSFIEAIQGGADLDGNGYVGMREVDYFIENRVRLANQTPQFGSVGLSGVDGDFLFRPSGLIAPTPTPTPPPTITAPPVVAPPPQLSADDLRFCRRLEELSRNLVSGYVPFLDRFGKKFERRLIGTEVLAHGTQKGFAFAERDGKQIYLAVTFEVDSAILQNWVASCVLLWRSDYGVPGKAALFSGKAGESTGELTMSGRSVFVGVGKPASDYIEVERRTIFGPSAYLDAQ